MLNIYNQKNNNHDHDIAPEVPSEKKTKVDASRYEDVTGEFTSAQFKRSLWFSKHKVFFYKLTIGLLVAVSVLFWGFSLIRWGDYLLNGIVADIKLRNDLVSFPDYTGIQAHYAPKPIEVAGVNVFNGGSKSYDLVADVANPNSNFIVYFDYYFTDGTNKTPVQKSFLLAGENRPVSYLGLKDNYPTGINLVLENVVWKRISAHFIQDVLVWQKDHLNFSVSDLSFTAPQGAEGAQANIIKFNVHNNSPFGYRDGVFVVGLMQSGNLVGVMPLNLKNFKSLESRAVDLRNFSENLLITDIELFPLIDIYQKEVYLAPER
jgi:hypothetical protein